MNKNKEILRFYEQVLALHPESSDEEQKSICRTAADIIEKQEGKMFRVDTWGSRPLANPKAKGVSRAFYFYMMFSAPTPAIEEMRRQFSINSKVLYFHQERLSKKTTPEEHIESFFQNLEHTAQKEKERVAKQQKRQNWTNKA